MHTHIELRLLGPPAILVNGERLHVTRRRALALFIYLACDRRPRSREGLAALFWPDATSPAARTSLRRALADLNTLLGKNWSQQDERVIELNPALEVSLNLDFLRPRSFSSTTPVASLDTWMPQVRAVFMEGLVLPGLDAWEEWRYMQAQAAKRCQREFAQRAAAVAWQQGDVARALQWTTIWIALDDLDEKAFRAHLEALARAGRVDRLSSEYQSFRARLLRELGVEPDPATRALFLSLRGTEQAVETSISAEHVRTTLRYVDVGDVRLATRVVGESGPWIVMVPGFATHLDFLLEHPDSASFVHRLAEGHRVLLFDKRGMGLSDRYPPGPPERNAQDALRIMDALQIQEAAVLGACEGGPAALAMAQLQPNRVSALVLDGTSACWHATPDYPLCASAEIYEEWIDEMQLRWGSAVGISQFAPSRVGDASVVAWWARMLRASATPSAIKAVFASAVNIDVRAVLPHVQQPTLVSHRRGDRVVRSANGRYLAEHLPNARYFEQTGADHWSWTERNLANALVDEIQRFLAMSRVCHA